ncbi:MAG: response regulator transcription factor [Myxococcota bacterium]
MARTILVVDDDPDVRAVIELTLRQEGYEPKAVASGEMALEAFEEGDPDLVILDVLLPDIDGKEVCRRIRRMSQVPIVFLSCRGEPIDRILGLELGADDYIPKPFDPRELSARIHAVFRRTERAPQPANDNANELICGRLRLDLDRHEAYWSGEKVKLTKTEFSILRTLMSKPYRVFPRQEIIEKAYEDHTIVSERTIDSHVRRIRNKLDELGAEPIETVHGVGFRIIEGLDDESVPGAREERPNA